MSDPIPRRVRADLPFRRIALVLSGGGALGAYEVGVLRVLETADIRPPILAGVSVGAINAVLWLAHGFRTAPLERVWSRLRASSVGMRWITLIVRALGATLVVVAAVQVVLTLAGSPELSPRRIFMRVPVPDGGIGALLDTLAWLLVGVAGVLVGRSARTAEATLSRLSHARDPHRLHRWFGRALLAGTVVHVVTWVMGLPWPHRFSASVLLVGGLAWFANRSGRIGDQLRRLVLRVLPETGGRGLWGSDARRRLIKRIVAEGDATALTAPETHLIISACAIESGHMYYFVNWPDPTPGFRERIAHVVGRVVPVARPDEIIEAAVASSAIPGVFEPVRIGDREFVDGGVFSNQPLHAVLADGADAVIVVLVSPSTGPPKPNPDAHLLGLAGRLLEIANWRNLQSELRALPPGWSRATTESKAADPHARPVRVCVVEPEGPLPGGLYEFSSATAAELKRRGASDAWRALEAAGWLTAPHGGARAAEPSPAAQPERSPGA
jgi:predicted acylesterase/phospholipase RssA